MSFFSELQRRNVVRVGIAYTLVCWVVAQVTEFAFESFGAPDWAIKSLIVLMLIGLPVVLAFSWIYEMTPEGLKKEKDIDRSQSITPQTGRRIDRVIIAVLVIALAFFAFDKYGREAAPEVAEVVSQEEPEQVAEVIAADNDAPDNSVAVLPFVAMSSGPDDEYFADGLTEEILNSLAQLPELLVTARTSAFVFKGDDIPPIPEIAERLGVKHVVEGSVRRSGDRLRVTAQLIRAEDGFHLWSNNYDGNTADTIEVQENIAERIAIALDVALDEEKSAAMRSAGLRDAEAFTAFQKGRDLFRRAHGEIDTIAGLRQANYHFNKVIELVPEFAEVYAYHADFYTHLMTQDLHSGPDERFTAEEAAAAYPAAIADMRAAVKYETNPARRLRNEVDLAYLEGNWRGLKTRTSRLFSQDICSDGNWSPTIANVIGLSAAHAEQSRKIVECDPLRSLSWFNLARALHFEGKIDEALEVAREGMEVAPGGWLEWEYARILISAGRYEEAKTVIDTAIRDPNFAEATRVLLAARQGDRATALEELGNLRDDFEESFMGIIVYAWAGQREDVNRLAARYDAHPWGSHLLWQMTHWCACDAMFDLDVTPNFARRIQEADIEWPPRTGREFPLKDW